ncbi:MAG: hypothetical protein KIH01_02640 [Candidatus Freyarchaeota archaeon]|nr:hypothetical protein [Candidatus Jordarchaeia archaeon]
MVVDDVTRVSCREVNLIRHRSLRMLNSVKRSLFEGDYGIAAWLSNPLQLHLINT